MKVNIVCNDPALLPHYQTPGAAGMDIHAANRFRLVIKPMFRALVPTGLSIELPVGYEAQLRPRSSLALKYGITLPNSPATIDSDYRGEIGVILQNLGSEDFIVNPGDRIAQMVIARYETVEWHIVKTLDETARGVGGFGSTGK